MRVYEAAKKHNKKTTDFVEIIQKLGIQKTNFHNLTEEEVKKIDTYFKKPNTDNKLATKVATVSQNKFPKIVRRGSETSEVVKEKLFFNKNEKKKPFKKDFKNNGRENNNNNNNQNGNNNFKKKTWNNNNNQSGFADKGDRENKDFKKSFKKPVAPAPEPVIASKKNNKGKRVKSKKYEKPEIEFKREQKDVRTDFRQEVRRKKIKKKPKVKESEVIHADGDTSIGMIKIPQEISIKELSEKLGVPSSKIIAKFFLEGKVLNINAILSFEEAEKVGLDYDVIVEKLEEENIPFGEKYNLEVESKNAEFKRAPVVTIMGHVDHGKTSLLDALRKTNVIDTEAGGITQSIGAYQVKIKDSLITFIDTPGHEAFTEMRIRGTNLTDIAVLIVAADDGVKPQTIEAISHAKAANVPIIVAINKIDKPGANPMKVKEELTKYGLVSTEWGGDTDFVEISAKQRTNLEELLEVIILTSELLELKVDSKIRAKAIVIESRLDQGLGAVADVLIQEGTLRKNDVFVAGSSYGRIRKMIGDKGDEVISAEPSKPVEIIGFNSVPEAGDVLYVVENEKTAKKIAADYQNSIKEAINKKKHISLEIMSKELEQSELKEIRCIVRTDTMGSNEALKDALNKLSNEEVLINIIQSSTGSISESDVRLAEISGAIIIGFNVRPTTVALNEAEKANIEIRTYDVIYKVIEDMEKAVKGMLKVEYREVYQGRLDVIQTFKVSNVGTIAGSQVIDGKITNHSKIRILRDNVVLHTGDLLSLKRYKDEVREATLGQECGISIKDFSDIKGGDVIEAFYLEEISK